MAIKATMTAAEASFGTFDSELNTSMVNETTNAELTIKLRVWLEQINPRQVQLPLFMDFLGPIQLPLDVKNDSDDVPWVIRQWQPKEWFSFTNEYIRDGQRFWNGRFWLRTPDDFDELDVPKGHPYCRPNIWCRFNLTLARSPADAHTSISVVQLVANEKQGHDFRSTAVLYSKFDLKSDFSQDHSGKWHRQRTFIHELGHSMGLPHIGVMTNAPSCTAAVADPKKDGTNSSECYDGANSEEADNVMGRGMKMTAIDALPWRKRLAEHTGTADTDWRAFRHRDYPRYLKHIPKRRAAGVH